MKVKTDTLTIVLETQAERFAVRSHLDFARNSMPNVPVEQHTLINDLIAQIDKAPVDD
jgi:hypothetical protein